MVPPESIFGVLPIWVGVFAALAATLGVSGALFYRRVVRLVLLGRREARFDQPLRRLINFLLVFVGQRKVMQRVSLKDLAGIGHALIFFGFLSFLLSYGIFIFGDSAWRPFSETILTEAGARAYAMCLDLVALVILSALTWAVIRRWLVKPHRLSFDLTRSRDAIIIVALIGALMASTLAHGSFLRGEGRVRAGVVGNRWRGFGPFDARRRDWANTRGEPSSWPVLVGAPAVDSRALPCTYPFPSTCTWWRRHLTPSSIR